MRSLFPFLTVLLFSHPSIATEQTITLRDGGIISGDVLSLSDGLYRIKTGSLGILAIPQSEVVSIESIDAKQNGIDDRAADASSDARSSGSEAVSVLQGSIVNNPRLMEMVQSLQSDPALQNVLQDPQLMQSIFSGDLDALADDPQIIELMNHDAVRVISKELE